MTDQRNYVWMTTMQQCRWNGEAWEPIQEAPQCHWQLTDEYEEPWQGDCGILFVFTDAGTPQEHGMKFCPRCGRALVTAEQEEK